MPTTKTRINITLPREIKDALFKLAKRERIPEATKATKLIEIALELEEDQAWDKIALERDRKGSRFISHRNAWK